MCTKAHYDGSIVLLLDGHTSHIPPRVVAYARSGRMISIGLAEHSSHISQLLDFCVFHVQDLLEKGAQNARTEMRNPGNVSCNSGALQSYA
jgi:hypothetical protein